MAQAAFVPQPLGAETQPAPHAYQSQQQVLQQQQKPLGVEPLGVPQQQQQQQQQQYSNAATPSGKKPKKVNKTLMKISDVINKISGTTSHVFFKAEETLRVKLGRLNAVDMLLAQHQDIEVLLSESLAANKPGARAKFLKQAFALINAHLRIEEEIFYPCLRNEAPPQSALRAVHDNHDQIKQLIMQLHQIPPLDARFMQAVQQLTTVLVQHFREEERGIMQETRRAFPAKRLNHLGKEMRKRSRDVAKAEKHQRLSNGMGSG